MSITKINLVKILAFARFRKIYDIESLSIDYIKNHKFSNKEIDEAEHELLSIEKLGGKIVDYFSDDYPVNLKNISKPPLVLSVLGDARLLKLNSIAIVGSRSASYNGLALAKNFAAELSQKDFTIISGLAKGVDAQAHLAAINKTIAVIGSGINVRYPKENDKLYDKILENGSCIVSEFAFDVKPIPANFPIRNRIIAGISLGCLVVEAGMKSGSLSTARMAFESNRQVFAIPGFAMDPKYKGNNHLIKKNIAKLTETVDDILDDLIYEPVKLEKKIKVDTLFEKSLKDNVPSKVDEVNDDGEINQQDSDASKVLGVLSTNAIGVDDICRKTKLPAHVVHKELMQLELSGEIISNGVNSFARKY